MTAPRPSLVHRIVPVLVLLVTLCGPGGPRPAVAQDAPPPRVERFSPQGMVKQVRQVVARFSAAMVPLGDPRAATGVFEIECPEPGTARWADGREWVYDFDRDLPAGVRCTFRLRPGLAALDGRSVEGSREFHFSTGGPAVRVSFPRQGASWIDEEQAFVLSLDSEATERSILDHVSFTVEGLAERIGARLVTGPPREAIVKARTGLLPAGPVVVVQARRRFPSGAAVSLVWGRGVTAPTGVATSEEQVLEFKVREAFRVTFRCEREQKDADCLAVSPMRVEFSAPVPVERARRLVLVGPGGRRWKAETREDAEALRWDVSFRGPFPERSAFRVEIPSDLRDDAERPPINADRFPLTVRTGPYPPLAKFSSRFGILERADPVLPVTVRRIEPTLGGRVARVDREPQGALAEVLAGVKGAIFRIPPEYSDQVLPWLRRVAEAKRETSIFGAGDRATRGLTLPRPGGADAFEVIGIPLGKPGLYVVELESFRLGTALLAAAKPMYVPTAALVTNLSVHLKWGTENALVWVTSLDQAEPVAGARVTVQDCKGTILWRGNTDAAGLVRVGGLPGREALPRCGDTRMGDDWSQSRALESLRDGLLVVAQTHDDLSFVHSSWSEGIEPWRFGLSEWESAGPITIHTILDRPLFRAGETVHMKHVLRRQILAGLGAAAERDRPTTLVIQHVGSEERHEVPVRWEAAGVAESTWAIPKAARLGRYQVLFARDDGREHGRRFVGQEDAFTAEFRVEEFRIPFMRAILRPPAEPLVGVSEVPLDVAVRYLAGGGAKRLPVTVRAQILPRASTEFEGFDGFTFANGGVAEGVTRRDTFEDEEAPAAAPAIHQREAITLDDAGTARATIHRVPEAAVPRDLLAEVEFRDPSGEVQTAARRIPLWPSRRLVGIRPSSPDVSGERVSAQVAVVDLAGHPVAGAPVKVDVLERRLYSHRKRLVGGFYAYEHVQEVRRRGELCRGTTGVGGVFVCEGTPGVTGQLVLQASSTDEAGHASVANQEVWVVDAETAWWFDVRDGDRMDVIPERRRYEPGETARFQVRMPFRQATALVTVEREGVAESRVVRLRGEHPVIEVPVAATFAPNVFVSVLAVRGRVADVQPTALVDLGRPAFKLGLAEIRVGWRAHELRVTVASDRPSYRVREKVPVRIAVKTPEGAPPPPGSEVAVAVVDEGLLELAPNPSWRLLDGMMRRRGYGVATSTAQGQVVGRRHYGLKALPSGGSGGRQTTRELFDTLLLWRARVALDARGEATVEVPLNDSLTAFRVVAVATGGMDRFGTGELTIRSTQDLMVLPGLPPVVRERDRFRAEVTLRNATTAAMDVTVTPRVEGLGARPAPRSLALAPGQAQVVGWDVTVPVGVAALRWEIEAATRGAPGDRVAVSQRVVAAVPVRTTQATIVQWEPGAGPIHQTVERPAGAVAGRGGVEVSLRPTLAGELDALREWMREYPYSCLEQEVSRAIVLGDATLRDRVLGSLPAHLDGQGLLKYFAQMPEGSEVLTAYVLAVGHAAGWRFPDEVLDRTTKGLAAFVEGKVARRPWMLAPDLTLRKLAAIEALARHGRARPAMLASLRIEPTLWPTSAVLDWWSILQRVSGVPGRAARLAEAEQVLRARLTVQGTTMGFSTEPRDSLWWLMISPDVNAARLVLSLLDAEAWKDDLPRIVRGALALQRRGRWGLTTANAWGALALARFSAVREREPVQGATSATLGGLTRKLDWARAPRGGALELAWPERSAEVSVTHEGGGRPWVTLQARAAIPLIVPVSSGYHVTRTVTPVQAQHAGRWTRGDLVRVRLEIEAQADMSWVVVNDPVPAGASHVGRGLATESATAVSGEAAPRGRAWLAYQERAFDAFRAYYAWVPKGRFTVEYTLRLDQSGHFELPATRVEALYAPEMHGESPNAPWEVGP